MPRIRTIKPEFFRDETLQDIQAQHPELNPMLVFAGLWTVCDKEGRFEWRPRVLHLDILPFLNFDFDASLVLLESFSMIQRYEIEGKQYGLVRTFTQHQRISGKEAQDPPKFPEPVCFLPVTESNSRGSVGEAIGKHPGSQEREREREKEREVSGEAREKKSAPRTIALPDSFEPNQKHIEMAEREGVNLRVEFNKFCDYCKANNKRYADWDAALRNWIRRSVEISGTRQPSLLPRRPVMR